MSILDIALASSLSSKNGAPAQDTSQIRRIANEAKSAAEEAKTSAAEAIQTAEQANQMATQANTNANAAKEKVDTIDIEDKETTDYTETTIKVGSKSFKNKRYKNIGTNEDGTMTQKAIKAYVDSNAGGSGAINLGAENKGKFAVIGENGELTAGIIEEDAILRAQILAGNYSIPGARGVEIDYENKTFSPIADPDNTMSLYEGINRCLVDDDGAIICFYGDVIYQDSYVNNYQTMVYVPKFYYYRLPIALNGKVIKKEVIFISDKKLSGFKLHPRFINTNGEEVDYFLYSAYEGSSFDVSANAYNLTDAAVDFSEDKLSSVTDAKPISGEKNQLNIDNAEKLAQNRGENWHVSDIKAESALQLLMLIDFSTFNGQVALERGISDISSSGSKNCASLTGSTASLGNETGHASSTINEQGGVSSTYNEVGYRAISYRGVENPWGNIWRLIRGIQIQGGRNKQGGVPAVYNDITKVYDSIDFMLPNNSDWISSFGYDETFDWIFIPAAATGANSALPVGDYVWVQSNLEDTNGVVLGGHWSFKDHNGPFYYGFDKNKAVSAYAYSARLVYIPQKGNIYNENVSSWKRSIGA